MLINSNKTLLGFLRGGFREILSEELKTNQALYREASLQCILYSSIKAKLSSGKYIYPEINYGRHKKSGKNNKSDLIILKNSIIKIKDEGDKRAFNISNYNEEKCESIIELKYTSTLGSIRAGIIEDVRVLKYNGNKIKNKIMLFLYEINKGEKLMLNNLVDGRKTKGVSIVGYTWDGEALRLLS